MDHPHHTLYQLFALKNGDRGRDGKSILAGNVVGGMSVTVDIDKVAAASEVLASVALHHDRFVLVQSPTQARHS